MADLKRTDYLRGQIVKRTEVALMIDELDMKIIALLQGDLPLEARPFKILAEKIDITEQEFLDRTQHLEDRQILRRFGATLCHREAGFSSNAMIAWRVPDNRIDKVGAIFSGFKEVTHCYQREPQRDWNFNLFTMVHGSNHKVCSQVATRMSLATGVDDYALLYSEKEFKKTSMEYFKEL
ncbi:MAG: hypothetical protein V2J25_03290 [Desulfatiglans sp.]|jgi:DNA-binding Lrp family transcriptional regulator|nr:AsnC family transcriptional regulator [Thermodesulfobacteriota bacterium]MEE4351870.1 hypothetical protein [Desulfatiglans sp.]